MTKRFSGRFDPATHTIGLDREFCAARMAEQPDPPVPFTGMTFGVAHMAENSSHGGEMHPDGDEVLYLISGRARIVFLEGDMDDVDLEPGDGYVVPRGAWHRVDIVEACQIVYLTPGPNNEFRPLDEPASP